MTDVTSMLPTFLPNEKKHHLLDAKWMSISFYFLVPVFYSMNVHLFMISIAFLVLYSITSDRCKMDFQMANMALTLCTLGNFSYFCCPLFTFFKINFKKFIREYYQGV